MVAIKSVTAFPRYLDILDLSKVTFFYSCYRSLHIQSHPMYVCTPVYIYIAILSVIA